MTLPPLVFVFRRTASHCNSCSGVQPLFPAEAYLLTAMGCAGRDRGMHCTPLPLAQAFCRLHGRTAAPGACETYTAGQARQFHIRAVRHAPVASLLHLVLRKILFQSAETTKHVTMDACQGAYTSINSDMLLSKQAWATGSSNSVYMRKFAEHTHPQLTRHCSSMAAMLRTMSGALPSLLLYAMPLCVRLCSYASRYICLTFLATAILSLRSGLGGTHCHTRGLSCLPGGILARLHNPTVDASLLRSAFASAS